MRGIDLLKKGPAKISRKRHRTQNMQVLPSPSHKLHVLGGTCLQFSSAAQVTTANRLTAPLTLKNSDGSSSMASQRFSIAQMDFFFFFG